MNVCRTLFRPTLPLVFAMAASLAPASGSAQTASPSTSNANGLGLRSSDTAWPRWQGRLGLTRGSPAALVNAARGLVTVNSTIGITALAANIPVIALGTAIYGLPGLTHQAHLDVFWRAPQPPDAALFAAFHRVVAARTQINGGFYSAQGIALAVEGALQRLLHTAALPAKPEPIRYLPQPTSATALDGSEGWVPPAVAAVAEYTVQA